MLFAFSCSPGDCRGRLSPNPFFPQAVIAAIALAAAVLSGCSGTAFLPQSTTPEFAQHVPNVSPHLTGPVQGIALDEMGNHYVSLTTSIVAYDVNWNLLWINGQPFAGIDATVDHMGDLEYSDGKLYVPVEHYRGCSDYSPVVIAVYDAATGVLLNWVDISGDGHEGSAAAVIGDNGQVVVSSFCQHNALWIYGQSEVNTAPMGSAVAAQGTIPLSQPVIEIQGISWNPQTSMFLMSSDLGLSAGRLWLVTPGGTVIGPVYNVPSNQGHELEGVDATQGDAYYEEKGFVYGMPMPGTTAKPTDSAGIGP